MSIRKVQESDRSSLSELWNKGVPDDSPHNEPSVVVEAKFAVEDRLNMGAFLE